MKIEKISITKLSENTGQLPGLPSNPRQWTKDELRRLAASLKETPELFEARPCLVYPHGGKYIVLGGNFRLAASKENKAKEVPCIVFPADTPVEKLKEIVIKDNGAFGSWDFDALANEWDDLPLVDWGVPVWDGEGATAGGVDIGVADVQEDDFDEDGEIAVRCKRGDIWQLGEHRLMCGDSTSAADFAQLMDDTEARLCVTSPPYGVGKSYEEYGIEPWREIVLKVIENITKSARIIAWNIADLFATGTQFIEPTSMYSTHKMAECGFGLMYARIWQKPGGNFTGTNPYYTVSMKPVQQYEWILGYAKKDYEKDYAPIIEGLSDQAKKAELNNDKLKTITGAGFMYGHWFTAHQWAMIDEANYNKIAEYCAENNIAAFQREYAEIRREYEDLNIYGKLLTPQEEADWGRWAIWEMETVHKRTADHPAEFPVELPARLIKMHSRTGDAILDSFGGTGTTLIAAEQLGRKAYLMEIDPHYCDVIIARWEKFTGNKAIKLN